MKTAEEIMDALLEPNADDETPEGNIRNYRTLVLHDSEFQVRKEDALRQLCEAIEREVIGEDEAYPEHDENYNAQEIGEIIGKQELRTEQRAKLRAFCGVGEQPSAVDDDWVDQQIERSDEA